MSNQFNLSDDAIRLIYGLLKDYQRTLLHVGEMPDKLEELDRSSTVSGILFWDDQVLERLRGRFLVADLKM